MRPTRTRCRIAFGVYQRSSGAFRRELRVLLFAAVSVTLEGCEALASSPPEVEGLATARPDAAAAPCLAQTHPILAHVGRLGERKLVALDPTGSAAISLDRGDFVYGSTWAPDGRSVAFRRRPASAAFDALAATELG